MCSSSREEIVEVFDALEAGYKRALDLTFDVLTTPERLRVLERWEQMRRWQPGVEHALINQLAEQADPSELGGNCRRRWLTGCGSAAPRPRGAFTRLPIWASGGR